jgi:hypothetical protein
MTIGPKIAVVECAIFAGDTTIQDNPNWRRHKGACAHYRERWTVADEPGDEGCRLLYQIFCLRNTPPLSAAEQERCMCASHGCWRLTGDGEAHRGRRKAATVSGG